MKRVQDESAESENKMVKQLKKQRERAEEDLKKLQEEK